MARGHYLPVSISAIAVLIGIVVAAQPAIAQTPAPQTPTPQAPATRPQAPQVPAPAPQASPPPAATQVLSAAQLQKINGWIADKGRDIAVTPIITDILGLTNGNQTLTCRAFATEGDGGEVHQIYVLPDGKGYLEAHFFKDRLDVYWADKNFALLAAVEGVRGQKPTAASFADAQYGFDFESAWWAKYTDAH
ncbi:MAG: hypothetical protein WBD71_12160 [Xanthobacteraceae bacterium]